MLVMVVVVVVAGTGLLPIVVAAVSGAAIMIVSRCLSWREALSALTPSVVMIIVVSLALGHAILSTGTDDFLARLFVVGTEGFSPTAIISLLLISLSIITNVVSNNAAAVIGTPIALSIAEQLGLPPEPLVLAVLFGANMSYATPMGYKTNLLIMSAGGYKFGDFVRVGIPLTIVMWLGFTFVLSALYGL